MMAVKLDNEILINFVNTYEYSIQPHENYDFKEQQPINF